MLFVQETVPLRKREEAKLEVVEMKMLRFYLTVTRYDRIRNKYITGTADIRGFGNKVWETRLRWFGHFQRRTSKCIGRRMLGFEFRQEAQRKIKVGIYGCRERGLEGSWYERRGYRRQSNMEAADLFFSPREKQKDDNYHLTVHFIRSCQWMDVYNAISKKAHGSRTERYDIQHRMPFASTKHKW